MLYGRGARPGGEIGCEGAGVETARALGEGVVAGDGEPEGRAERPGA